MAKEEGRKAGGRVEEERKGIEKSEKTQKKENEKNGKTKKTAKKRKEGELI